MSGTYRDITSDGWTECGLKRVASLQSGDSISADVIDSSGVYPVYGGNGIRGYTSAYNRDGTHVLVGRQGALCGNIHYASGKYWASEHAVVVSAIEGNDIRWLGYLLYSLNLGRLSQSAAQPGLAVEEIARLSVPVPPAETQRAIADYLEAVTGRINALVAARRHQADLIDERIKTAIWSAVTKGMGPTARAPSGVDWIGDMPRHWSLPWVAANFDVQLGKMLNPDAARADERFPYLRNVNVQWDRIDLDDLHEMHFDAQDRLRYALEPGDLVVCEGGEVGRAAVWDGAIAGCYYQKALHRVRSRGDANMRFLMYALWAAASQGVFENEGNTSTIVHLTAEKLRVHRFPWPPIAEQDEIVDALDCLREESGQLKTVYERQIELLLERRQALITAAVTGELETPGLAA